MSRSAHDPEGEPPWTLVRLARILVDRFRWGGYNEAPFITIAELLCQDADA